MCHGLKFLSAQTIGFGFYNGLGVGQDGLGSVLLALCVEAVTGCTSSKTIEVDFLVDDDMEDDQVHRIEGEVEGLKQGWKVASEALSRIPGTCRVELEVEITY